jgi:hypothetical protein
MSILPRISLTRAAITQALTDADADGIILPRDFYSRRIDHSRQACLALDPGTIGDYGVFVAIIGSLASSPLDFANDARPIPLSPTHTVTWPGIVLTDSAGEPEPTQDEWHDQINECPTCQAADGETHGCPAHVRAPWDPPIPGQNTDAVPADLEPVPTL